jgi:DNA-binding IclR family transcriptional regulator
VLSEELRRFVRDTFRSVWALELLLLMCAEPARTWTAEDLNRELRGSRPLVDEILTRLEQSGLVKEGPETRYRYEPATLRLGQLVQELQIAYAERPLAVLKAIFAAPNERIQTFADAFKVKKD